MVALNRQIIFTLAACCIGMLSGSAQTVEPRIQGLEANDRYMNLLREDNKMTMREDSITVIVESLREAYRADSEDSSGSRNRIISLENELFELRARKAVLVDSLNVIEQEWVLNNMEQVVPDDQKQSTVVVAQDADVKYIFESQNVKQNLSDIDYQNLINAEKREEEAIKLSSSYIVNHDNMLSLKRSYDSTSIQSEAMEIKSKFDSLSMANAQIIERLSDTWGYIYDNKSFAYSMLMELLGFADVLQQEAELMRSAQAEISLKSGDGGVEELLRYQVQKRSMVKFETLVAEKLGLSNLVKSFEILSAKLAGANIEILPNVTIEERLFILYEPIEFVSKPLYNASNPIPETAMYDKGVIFRIFVGSFSSKQPVSMFRSTTPLSCYRNEQGRYCYYIGGFETYEEAMQAQALLKKRGFRSPQVVVWSDGRERNLTKEPLPISTNYRLEIIDAATLPDGVAEKVSEIAPNSSISKVGNDKFVIVSLQRSSQADSLVNALRNISSDLKIVVEKSETEIEF